MKKLALTLLIVLFTFSCKQKTAQKIEANEPTGEENIAYKWGEIALEATALDTERFKPRPTITSRYLGLIFVAVLAPGLVTMKKHYQYT